MAIAIDPVQPSLLASILPLAAQTNRINADQTRIDSMDAATAAAAANPLTAPGSITNQTTATPITARTPTEETTQSTKNVTFTANTASQQVVDNLRAQALLEQESEARAQASALLAEASAAQAQVGPTGSTIDVLV